MSKEVKNKRLGVVKLSMKYVVDLDDEDMVSEAKQCLFEDITSMLNADELFDTITVESDDTVTWEDVPDFLKEEVGDVYEMDTEEEVE